MVDRKPFKIGENLAATPGAVIYRTEVFELIQYTPQCDTVYQRPILMVPPQVNKYYALDLVTRPQPVRIPAPARHPGVRDELAQPDGGAARLGLRHLCAGDDGGD